MNSAARTIRGSIEDTVPGSTATPTHRSREHNAKSPGTARLPGGVSLTESIERVSVGHRRRLLGVH